MKTNRSATLGRRAEVIFADGADAAHRLLDGQPDDAFDLVLCDVMMPGRSGIDLFDSVRRTRPSVADRFVFITGGAFGDEARSFLSSMVERVVSKPFRADELRRLLARRI